MPSGEDMMNQEVSCFEAGNENVCEQRGDVSNSAHPHYPRSRFPEQGKHCRRGVVLRYRHRLPLKPATISQEGEEEVHRSGRDAGGGRGKGAEAAIEVPSRSCKWG